jgi:hypothetical protein
MSSSNTKDLEQSIRMIGQVLQVRAWDVEAERARFSQATQAFTQCEQVQQGIEAEIDALEAHARSRLASGRALDVGLLQHARLHGESRRKHLLAAQAEAQEAHAHQEKVREALTAVVSERRALDSRRDDMQAEWQQIAVKRMYREQDESQAARTKPAKGDAE